MDPHVDVENVRGCLLNRNDDDKDSRDGKTGHQADTTEHEVQQEVETDDNIKDPTRRERR